MTTIFGSLNIGRTALSVQQTAINVTGHNIANVNTEGYTRQRVNMESTSSSGYATGTIGTGVGIENVERIFDKFVQNQISSQNQELGYWEGMKEYLDQVEIVFNEANGVGISTAMDDFWNAWNDVANNPSGYVERISLLSKSSTMAMTFNQSHDSLTRLQDHISGGIEAALNDVNLKAGQVKDLNQQILQMEGSGQTANDLRDQRDLLVKEISRLIDVNTSEDSNGNVNVFTSDGHPLVSGTYSWTLSTAVDPASPLQDDIIWNGGDGTTVDITGSITGGKIKGMLDVRDSVIPEYVDRLNQLAGSVIDGVNTLHGSGSDLNGDDGGVFFNAPGASDAAKTIAVAIEDTDLIAAAASGEGAGGNFTALSIAELQNSLSMETGTATFGDFYRSLVSEVGNAVSSANNNLSNKTAMIDQLENYRESISGVSLDEEMVNLVKYQHAYDAAAKLISTVDEMLDSLLNLI